MRNQDSLFLFILADKYIMNIDRKILKTAGLESSTISDLFTGHSIRVSTTVRNKFRKSEYFENTEVASMNNPVLNDFIGTIFSNSGNPSENILHYFISKNSTEDSVEWIEIRKVNDINIGGKPLTSLYTLFFSVLRGEFIDIINVSGEYKKPKKARTYKQILKIKKIRKQKS